MGRKIVYSIAVVIFLLGNMLQAQQARKTLWILFDPEDKLSEKVKDTCFYFFEDSITSYSIPIDFCKVNSKRSTFQLKRLPGNCEPVDRKQLITILQGIPNSIIKSDGREYLLLDTWYDRVYKKTYIVEKQDGYYKVYKVNKVYSTY